VHLTYALTILSAVAVSVILLLGGQLGESSRAEPSGTKFQIHALHCEPAVRYGNWPRINADEKDLNKSENYGTGLRVSEQGFTDLRLSACIRGEGFRSLILNRERFYERAVKKKFLLSRQ